MNKILVVYENTEKINQIFDRRGENMVKSFEEINFLYMSLENQSDHEFVKFEDPEYRRPLKGEVADGRKVDNPNSKNLETSLDSKNKESELAGTKRILDIVKKNETSDRKIDHPTPDEILAQLNSSFLGSNEKPKDSVEGGVQVVEGSTQKLEVPTAN